MPRLLPRRRPRRGRGPGPRPEERERPADSLHRGQTGLPEVARDGAGAVLGKDPDLELAGESRPIPVSGNPNS